MTLDHWQYITQGNSPEEHLDNATEAMLAGCRWLQLRMKNVEDAVFLETALVFRNLCMEHESLCIINDKVDIAKEVNADGVHLGKEDISPVDARRILGKKAIIGGTANTFEDIVYLAEQKVNYIGLGPFRFTSTKKKLSPVLGLEGYAEIMQQMKMSGINIPVHAIGGITLEDISDLMKTGVTGIAVSGLVTHAKDKKTLINHIHSSLKGRN